MIYIKRVKELKAAAPAPAPLSPKLQRELLDKMTCQERLDWAFSKVRAANTHEDLESQWELIARAIAEFAKGYRRHFRRDYWSARSAANMKILREEIMPKLLELRAEDLHSRGMMRRIIELAQRVKSGGLDSETSRSVV